MGFLTWLAGGIGAALVARRIRHGKGPAIPGEAATAIASAIVAGILATALDFGGWNEFDLFALLFTFFTALTMIALYRAAKWSIIRTRPS
jgi:uncharacterized membrane protein YeaQ/YmgE (transglycosylase-associated protein family)